MDEWQYIEWKQYFIDILIISDGIAHILQQVRPSFIFCDSDILETVNGIADKISLNAKLFLVDKQVNDFETIDSLMTRTSDENEFV